MYCGTLVATPQHTQKILSQSKKGMPKFILVN